MGDYTNRPEGIEPEKWGYSDDLEQPDDDFVLAGFYCLLVLSCLAIIVFLISSLIWGLKILSTYEIF
jgi:hypothetical protein